METVLKLIITTQWLLVAVQRKYEYVRRQWKDEKDETRQEMQKVTAKCKKPTKLGERGYVLNFYIPALS